MSEMKPDCKPEMDDCTPDTGCLPGQEYVGYAFVPIQAFGELYSYDEALKRGTAFPALDKPMGVYGHDFKMPR